MTIYIWIYIRNWIYIEAIWYMACPISFIVLSASLNKLIVQRNHLYINFYLDFNHLFSYTSKSCLNDKGLHIYSLFSFYRFTTWLFFCQWKVLIYHQWWIAHSIICLCIHRSWWYYAVYWKGSRLPSKDREIAKVGSFWIHNFINFPFFFLPDHLN